MNKTFRQVSLIVLLIFGFSAYLVQDFYPWILWLLFPLEFLCILADWLIERHQLQSRSAIKLGKSQGTLWQLIGYMFVGGLFLFLGLRDSYQHDIAIYENLNAYVAAGSLFFVGGYFKYFPYFIWVSTKRMHFGYNAGKSSWLLNELIQVRINDTFMSLEDTRSTMEVDLSPLKPTEREVLVDFLRMHLGSRMKG